MRSHLTAVLAALTLFPAVAESGPWTRRSGELFLWAGFTTIGYAKVYDDGSVKQGLPVDVRDNVVRLIADYGLAEGLSLSAGLPYGAISVKPNNGQGADRSRNGIGDPDLGIRRGWRWGSDAVAVELLATIPAGSAASSDGLLLGSGEWAFLLAPSWGRSFRSLPLFVSATAGVRFRTGDFSHEFRYGAEVGYSFFGGAATTILEITGQESFGNTPTLTSAPRPDDAAAAALGLYTNNREYLAITPKVLVRPASGWGIVLSYATAAKGRNVAGGAVIGGGVYRVF